MITTQTIYFTMVHHPTRGKIRAGNACTKEGIPKFYTARTKRAVNSEGSIRQRTTSAEACAAVACSDDPRELVRVAFEHWDNIGWPEDKEPVSLLKRALELLSC